MTEADPIAEPPSPSKLPEGEGVEPASALPKDPESPTKLDEDGLP